MNGKKTTPDGMSGYMTVSEVRDYLSIGKTAAYELVHRADFPVCRIGGSIRVPRNEFLSWVERRSRIPYELRRGLLRA